MNTKKRPSTVWYWFILKILLHQKKWQFLVTIIVLNLSISWYLLCLYKLQVAASCSLSKMVFIMINWDPGDQIMMEKHHFAHSPQKNEFCDFNVLPPCSAGKTLTAFGIPRDKRFPALLSKFMALRRQIENKKGTFTVPISISSYFHVQFPRSGISPPSWLALPDKFESSQKEKEIIY